MNTQEIKDYHVHLMILLAYNVESLYRPIEALGKAIARRRASNLPVLVERLADSSTMKAIARNVAKECERVEGFIPSRIEKNEFRHECARLIIDEN